ncbi:MAG: hypothetical protein ACK4E5_03750 [Erythrobacter cryptus]
MGDEVIDQAADNAVEALLTEAVAREQRALAAVVPVLRHLLGSEAEGLVSDAVLARVRGMIGDLSAQIVAARAGRDPAMRAGPEAEDQIAHWSAALIADEALLAFCHALAAEGLIAERLHQRHAIDPVLSPLLQELIAAQDPATASLAMRTLAAQARFIQSQRRMELPLGELPAELFHALALRAGLEHLQAGHDEGASRIGLLARLVAAMRGAARAALGLEHAGLALFASALAAATRLPRGALVLACHEGQGARLALALRAAGAALPEIERQCLLIAPAARMPRAIAALAPARAGQLLASDPAW